MASKKKKTGLPSPHAQMEMILGLFADVSWAEKVAKGAEPKHLQSARRAYVRALFALIEGALLPYRDFLLTRTLTAEQRDMLNDVGPNGSKTFTRLDEKWRIIYELLLRELGSKTKPNYVTSKWQFFKKAIVIRNRITHPKTNGGVDVSDAEMAILEAAFEFCHGELMKEVLVAWVKRNPEETRNIGKWFLEFGEEAKTLLADLPVSALDEALRQTRSKRKTTT